MTKSFRELVGEKPVTASPSDSTLVIIDAQNEYAEGHLKTRNVESTRAAIKDLLDRYRQAGSGKNIVHVIHKTPPGAPVFTQGTKLAEQFLEIKPESGEHTIEKEMPGSFTNTNLDSILKENGASKVVLTGFTEAQTAYKKLQYMAHVCVSTTARQAMEHGYQVVLPKEAIGDRDIPGANGSDVVEGSLRELSDAFATVVSASDIK